MKNCLMMLLVLVSVNAFAGGSDVGSSGDLQARINDRALEVLISRSAQLTTQDGQSVAKVLAGALTTGEATHNKISNSCAYDKNDRLFNCVLTILNADDAAEARTESSSMIRYQLESDKKGLPSMDLFTLSVELFIAG